MTAEQISRVEHEVSGGGGIARTSTPTHEEEQFDLDRYTRALERVHAGTLHGSGVVDGFDVVAPTGATSVRVAPGVVVDAQGRHVVLAAGGQAQLSAVPDSASQLQAVTPDGVNVPTRGQSGLCAVTVEWRETFGNIRTQHTPWLLVQPMPLNPSDAGAFVLATLTLDTSGAITAGTTAAGTRRGPTLPVGAVEVLGVAAGPTATGVLVSQNTAGTLHATDHGLRADVTSGGTLEVGASALVVDGGAAAGPVRLDGATSSVVAAALRPGGASSTVSLGGGATAGTLSVRANLVTMQATAGDAPITIDPGGGQLTARQVVADDLRVSGSTGQLAFVDAADVTHWHVNNQLGGVPALNFAETGVSDARLYLQAGGRVGVNTSAPAFALHVNGTVCATDFCNPSDLALKREVTPLQQVLDRITSIRGVSFRNADDGDARAGDGLDSQDAARPGVRRKIGVLAQDVRQAFPELVMPIGDSGLDAVDYMGLTGVLVQAVHELLTANAGLAARLDALEQDHGTPRGTAGDG